MGRVCTVFFWRAILAEFLASTIYSCIALGVVVNSDVTKVDDQLRIAVTFGLTLACVSYMFAASSGGHVNPAVTLASVIARRITIWQTIGYLIVQCGGAITGAAIIYALTPSSRRGNLGALELHNSTTYWQGFAMEGIIGFVVAFVYLTGTDPNREDSSFGPGLAYGSATIGAHLLAIPYTGCGLNPARALAPAILKSHWPSYHWIYWAGPIVGAALAGLFYWLVFSVPDENSSGSADFIHTSDYIIERPPGLTNGGFGSTKM